MSIFQTFYILFKSNAEEVEKKTRAAEKAGKDLEDNLGKQNKQAEELGKSFTKIVEGLTSAVTAYVSFGAIKSGIINTGELNAALERTSQATGQNVRDIAVYGNALKQFGGDSQTFQQSLRAMTQAAAEQGRQLPPLAEFLKSINRQFQGLSLNESARIGKLLGITDPAELQLLRQTTEEYDKQIAIQERLTAVTPEATKSALQFSQAWANVGTVFSSVFTNIGSDVFPVLTGLANHLTELGVYMKGHNIFSEVALGGAAAGITTLAGVITRMFIPALAGMSAAALPILGVIAGVLGVGAAGIAAYDYYNGTKKETPVSRKPSAGGSSAVSFWESQGYTHAQAVAWAAQEQAESSGRPGAYNAGHYGLYQWSEARRAKILSGTGIDVATANIDDQRRAAAWEADQRGDAGKVKSTGSMAAANNYLTRNFEIPASGAALDAEVAKRYALAGKIALSDVSSSPYSSAGNVSTSTAEKNIAVSMGDVHVHTQATDARGIAIDLHGQIQSVISNHDDGISM